ncbi:MAG: ABC transporter ATP-binding protein [Roseiarcus sp.]
MTPPLLEVDGLHQHFHLPRHDWLQPRQVRRAVDGVSFVVEAGRSFGIVGESGSGKSTLARAAMALRRPTAGAVRIEGRSLYDLPHAELKALRADFQMIFQDPYGSLDPRQTVERIVAEPLANLEHVKRAERRQRVSETLAAVGLDAQAARKYPHEFSGGQRQRIAIARALVTRPKLVVADEPVSALDVSTRAQIMNLLRDLQRMRGLTMLFISHDLSVVAHMCRDVAVMYLGRIVELAPRAALFNTPLHPYTAALMSAIPVPDPVRERGRARTVLEGEPPDPAAIPSGCRFHTRCPRATDLCKQVDPETRLLGVDHHVACHHPLEHARL